MTFLSIVLFGHIFPARMSFFLLFSAGEDLLADIDTQSVTESDSAESKKQHDACVRGQQLWKYKTGDYVKHFSLHIHIFQQCEDSLFPVKRDEASEADGSQSGMKVLAAKPGFLYNVWVIVDHHFELHSFHPVFSCVLSGWVVIAW